MNQHWSKFKIHYSIAIFLIVIAGLTFFLVVPMFRNIQQEADSIEDVKLTKIHLENKLGEIETVRMQGRLVEGNKYLTDEVFIEEGQIVDFIRKLEGISQDLDVETKIQIVDTEKPLPGETGIDIMSKVSDIPHIKMKVVSYGDFDKLVTFINKIENLDNYLSVYSVMFSKEEINQNSNRSNIFQRSSDLSTTPLDELSSTLGVIVYLEK